MTTISSIAGDTVDIICRRVYGDESGYVEAVMQVNPGIAELGVFLPVATVVTLPDLGSLSTDTAITALWD